MVTGATKEGVATKLPEMRFNIVGLNVANMSHVIMNVPRV